MNWTERIAPDEQARFDGYAAELRELARKNARGNKPGRALHLKAHVGAVGELEVGELPPALRVGPFAKPGRWPLYARFSNGSGARQHDGTPDVRGVALKLVGVPGKKIIPGLQEKKTQDFLFIHTPATPFVGPDDFVELVRAASKGKALLPLRLLAAFGPVKGLRVIQRLLSMPAVGSLATARFYTALPLRFGETAAKLALLPQTSGGALAKGKDFLRDDLVQRLKAGPVEYRLQAQLFVDEPTTPIEDASVEWPAAKAPWVDLGTVRIAQQDVASARGQQIEGLVESLSFDPWHAVEELRPLGAMMRARSAAYRESVLQRKAADEPESIPGA
jgi:hypothetical protein